MNHPLINSDSDHYKMVGGVEAITYLETMFSREELMAWAKITAMKYRMRIGKKDDSPKELKKLQTFEEYYDFLSSNSRDLITIPKQKRIIKKIDQNTIEIHGTTLTLLSPQYGKDYFVCEIEGDYCINYKPEGIVCGGFHYGLCGEEFEPINSIGKKHAKKLAGINAYSIWDQYHRPTCDPKGMSYVPKLDIWVDVYLLSDQYEEVGTSAAGFNILAGYEYRGRKLPKGKTECKWQDFKEIGEKFGKRMLTEKEFQVSMYGVKENHSAGDLDNGITKHIPDFMSKYGIEQATGCQWIWSSENYQDYSERKKVFGGYRDDTVESGSRCSNWTFTVWNTNWSIGCRYACDPLHPAKMSGSESLENLDR